jgi:hypothetical protein
MKNDVEPTAKMKLDLDWEIEIGIDFAVNYLTKLPFENVSLHSRLFAHSDSSRPSSRSSW